MAPYRVAGLVDDPFDLPSDAPGRTDHGDVWLRWANVGSYAGWYAIGTRRPAADKNSDFWTKVYALSAAVGNATVDGVHAIGPGILSLGGLGVTAASGFAQALLGECLEDHPSLWLKCMGPALIESASYPLPDPEAPSGWSFGPVSAEAIIRNGKERSRLWVLCCSHMLRDDLFDDTQIRFLTRVGPKVMGDELRERLRFGKVRDTWAWSQEQQALWATALVLALADTEMASLVMMDAFQEVGWHLAHPHANGPAEATLLSLRDAIPVLAPRAVPEHFVSRLARTLEHLPRYFEVRL